MLVIEVRVTPWGRNGRRTLNGYPKGLSVKLLSYKKMFNQASNVNGTGTQIHGRVIFVSSPSTASQARSFASLACVLLLAIMELYMI